MIDLRLGDWRETMADVGCDALVSDPPFSQRTEDGFCTTAMIGTWAERGGGVGYAPIDEAYVREFVSSWVPRVRYWMVIFGDHISWQWWHEALTDAGLYTFPPVIWAKLGAAPRLLGDGPGSQVEYISVARTRGRWAMMTPGASDSGGWGSLPGWYQANTVRAGHGAQGVTGAKPETLMRALVRDYSRPGWTIADPHAGSGTTLVAARAEGRHCIGSELDPNTYEIARKRLAQGWTPEMFPPRDRVAG